MSAASTSPVEITDAQAVEALIAHLRSHGVRAADDTDLDLLRAIHDWAHQG